MALLALANPATGAHEPSPDRPPLHEALVTMGSASTNVAAVALSAATPLAQERETLAPRLAPLILAQAQAAKDAGLAIDGAATIAALEWVDSVRHLELEEAPYLHLARQALAIQQGAATLPWPAGTWPSHQPEAMRGAAWLTGSGDLPATAFALQALDLLDPAGAGGTPAGLNVGTPTLAVALDGFLMTHQQPPLTALQRAQAALVPEPTASAVTSILSAAIQLQAASLHIADTPGALDALVAARNAAAGQVAAAIPGLTRAAWSLDIPEVIRVNLAATDDEVVHDYVLSIDVGGNDTYRNNAGATPLNPFLQPQPAARRAAMLIDVAGDDSYLGREGLDAVNGAGRNGIGFLWDDSGNDTYVVSGTNIVANGAGAVGVGTLIDIAGSDRYQLTAQTLGAANGGGGSGIGTLIDAGPTGAGDVYVASSGGKLVANGGAIDGGRGLLVDRSGDDLYQATATDYAATNGASYVGSALLLDGSGDDRYLANLTSYGSANGAGFDGHAALTDLGGHDIYWATIGNGAANGAGRAGSGLILDRAGDDRYHALIWERGVANGGGVLGSGAIVEGEGDDHFNATIHLSGDANGGASLGTGLVLDRAGDDLYAGQIGSYGSLNGGSQFAGVGCLLDMAGNDHYRGAVNGTGGINGGTRYGLSLLSDRAGNDTYGGHLAEAGGVNGGASAGIAMLEDRGGDNHFTGKAPLGSLQGAANNARLDLLGSVVDRGPLPPPGGSVPPVPVGWLPAVGTGVAPPASLAILLGSPGNDTYAASGEAQGAASLYSIGILLDPGGRNQYNLSDGLGQGAGHSFGIGLLIDAGHHTSLSLAGTSRGQGAGLQGIGLLLRDPPTHSFSLATTSYAAAPTSQPNANTGGGVSLLLDRSVSQQTGARPGVDCGANTLARLDLAEDDKLILCSPRGAPSDPVYNPATGEPVGTLEADALCPEPCSDAVGPHAPGAAAWLNRGEYEASTAGGFLRIDGRGDTPTVTVVTLLAPDHSCEASCPVMDVCLDLPICARIECVWNHTTTHCLEDDHD